MEETISIWKKQCPKCNKEQLYSCKSSYTNAYKKNKICLECTTNISRKYNTNDFEKKCSSCGNNQKYSCRKLFNRSMKNDWLCRKCATKESSKSIDRSYQKTDEYKEKMSLKLKNAWKISKNYRSELHRERLRESKLNQIKKLGTINNYNPDACKFIDELNKKFGWNLQHALNGGEINFLGYSLDGYDKEKNIVFEYDESRHNSPSKIPFDLIRQNRIINKMNPNLFIRYNERFNVIKDVITNKEIL